MPLQNEIVVLEKTFGRLLGSCQIHSTVPHEHLYGLLFRLLWPLAAGRPFADDTLLLWEELASSMRPSHDAALVTSPAHLERISLAGKKLLTSASPRMIFSSGGPLRESAVQWIREMAGQAPVEVYGSTETGGIAWRRRDGDRGADVWTPLLGVVVSQKPLHGVQALRVRSPFAPKGEGSIWTGDCGVVLNNGTLRLEGRTDRVVKVAEHRVSLEDMEHRLEKHLWVSESKVILLEPGNGVARRGLATVIVLSSKGRSQLHAGGRAALSNTFRNHLRQSFVASTVPRSFRFVDALPRNAQGKLPQEALHSLFQSRFDPSVTEAQHLGGSTRKSRRVLHLKVPERLAYFEGHFPQHPVVPGIVQLRWVVEAASEWLKRPLTVRRMEAIKFKNLLLPGRPFSLEIENDRSGPDQILRFSLTEKKTLYSSGRLVLE